MDLILKAVCVAITLSLIGCASAPANLSHQAIPSPDQKIFYGQVGEIIASGGQATVLASVFKSDANYIVIAIGVKNLTPNAQDLIAQNITAQTSENKPLHILSADEQAIAIDDINSSSRIGLALQGAGAAMSGGNQTAYHSGTVNGQSYSGTSTYSASNYQNMAAIEQSQNSLEAKIAADKEFYVRNRTVFPDGTYEAELWIAVPHDGSNNFDVLLSIPLAGEDHIFKWAFQRAGG